jgi:nicotinate-nucleotide adenylyltransferase
MDLQLLTILGGTFDPVHYGHLRLAVEIIEELSLDKIYLMPAKEPPHRAPSEASIAQRIAMLKICCQLCPQIDIELAEANRAGKSYTIDTLHDLRKSIGAQQPLAITIGMDTFLQFHKWHKWQEIINLCHILVARRPNLSLEIHNHELQEFYNHHVTTLRDDLKNSSHGKIYILQQTSMLDISATHIRNLIKDKKSAQFLLPCQVLDYIMQNKLYLA